MFCSRCGKRLDGRARFCDECGMPRREPAGRAGESGLVYGAAVHAGDVLVPSPPDPPVPDGVPASIATGRTPGHQALPGGPWSAEFTSATPAGVAQSLSVHPTINVAVTPPPAPAPVAGATVIVVGDGGQSLAMIAAWVLGMAAATGLTVMVIAAFITARAPEALVIALPLLLAFYALAAVGLRRGR